MDQFENLRAAPGRHRRAGAEVSPKRSVRVLAVARDGDTTTIVTYGRPGDSGAVVLATEQPLRVAEKGRGLTVNLGNPLHAACGRQVPRAVSPDACVLTDGHRRVRVVALNSEQALYTWLRRPEGQAVAWSSGRQYVSEFRGQAQGRLPADRASVRATLLRARRRLRGRRRATPGGRRQTPQWTRSPRPGSRAGKWPRRGKPRRTSTIPNGNAPTIRCRWARMATPARLPGIARTWQSPPTAPARCTSPARTTRSVFVNGQPRRKQSAMHGDKWRYRGAPRRREQHACGVHLPRRTREGVQLSGHA